MIDYSGLMFPKGRPRVIEKLEKEREASRVETACRVKVRLRDKGRCFFPNCKVRMSQMHHILPRSLGGKWITSNILSSCARHHGWFKAGLIVVKGNPDNGPVMVEATTLGWDAKVRVPGRTA